MCKKTKIYEKQKFEGGWKMTCPECGKTLAAAQYRAWLPLFVHCGRKRILTPKFKFNDTKK